MELGFPACSVDRFVADPESGMTLPNPAIVPNFTHLVPPEGHDWIYPFTTLPHYHSQNAGPWCAVRRPPMLWHAQWSHLAKWLITMAVCRAAMVLRMAVVLGAGTSTRRCAMEETQCPPLRKRTQCLCMTTGEDVYCGCLNAESMPSLCALPA